MVIIHFGNDLLFKNCNWKWIGFMGPAQWIRAGPESSYASCDAFASSSLIVRQQKEKQKIFRLSEIV
jgi:hypothetical protein